MASETKRTSFALTASWQDLCVTFTDIVGVDVTIQAKNSYRSLIIFGGASPPSDTDASLELVAGQSVRGSSDHIWVKGGGALTVHVEG